MNQPQVSIFPAELTTALYRRAIALHIESPMVNEHGEARGAAVALALLTDMLESSLLTAPPVLTARGCEVMTVLYRTLPAAFDDFCDTGVSLYRH